MDEFDVPGLRYSCFLFVIRWGGARGVRELQRDWSRNRIRSSFSLYFVFPRALMKRCSAASSSGRVLTVKSRVEMQQREGVEKEIEKWKDSGWYHRGKRQGDGSGNGNGNGKPKYSRRYLDNNAVSYAVRLLLSVSFSLLPSPFSPLSPPVNFYKLTNTKTHPRSSTPALSTSPPPHHNHHNHRFLSLSLNWGTPPSPPSTPSQNPTTSPSLTAQHRGTTLYPACRIRARGVSLVSWWGMGGFKRGLCQQS